MTTPTISSPTRTNVSSTTLSALSTSASSTAPATTSNNVGSTTSSSTSNILAPEQVDFAAVITHFTKLSNLKLASDTINLIIHSFFTELKKFKPNQDPNDFQQFLKNINLEIQKIYEPSSPDNPAISIVSLPIISQSQLAGTLIYLAHSIHMQRTALAPLLGAVRNKLISRSIIIQVLEEATKYSGTNFYQLFQDQTFVKVFAPMKKNLFDFMTDENKCPRDLIMNCPNVCYGLFSMIKQELNANLNDLIKLEKYSNILFRLALNPLLTKPICNYLCDIYIPKLISAYRDYNSSELLKNRPTFHPPRNDDTSKQDSAAKYTEVLVRLAGFDCVFDTIRLVLGPIIANEESNYRLSSAGDGLSVLFGNMNGELYSSVQRILHKNIINDTLVNFLKEQNPSFDYPKKDQKEISRLINRGISYFIDFKKVYYSCLRNHNFNPAEQIKIISHLFDTIKGFIELFSSNQLSDINTAPLEEFIQNTFIPLNKQKNFIPYDIKIGLLIIHALLNNTKINKLIEQSIKTDIMTTWFNFTKNHILEKNFFWTPSQDTQNKKTKLDWLYSVSNDGTLEKYGIDTSHFEKTKIVMAKPISTVAQHFDYLIPSKDLIKFPFIILSRIYDLFNKLPDLFDQKEWQRAITKAKEIHYPQLKYEIDEGAEKSRGFYITQWKQYITPIITLLIKIHDMSSDPDLNTLNTHIQNFKTELLRITTANTANILTTPAEHIKNMDSWVLKLKLNLESQKSICALLIANINQLKSALIKKDEHDDSSLLQQLSSISTINVASMANKELLATFQANLEVITSAEEYKSILQKKLDNPSTTPSTIPPSTDSQGKSLSSDVVSTTASPTTPFASASASFEDLNQDFQKVLNLDNECDENGNGSHAVALLPHSRPSVSKSDEKNYKDEYDKKNEELKQQREQAKTLSAQISSLKEPNNNPAFLIQLKEISTVPKDKEKLPDNISRPEFDSFSQKIIQNATIIEQAKQYLVPQPKINHQSAPEQEPSNSNNNSNTPTLTPIIVTPQSPSPTTTTVDSSTATSGGSTTSSTNASPVSPEKSWLQQVGFVSLRQYQEDKTTLTTQKKASELSEAEEKSIDNLKLIVIEANKERNAYLTESGKELRQHLTKIIDNLKPIVEAKKDKKFTSLATIYNKFSQFNFDSLDKPSAILTKINSIIRDLKTLKSVITYQDIIEKYLTPFETLLNESKAQARELYNTIMKAEEDVLRALNARVLDAEAVDKGKLIDDKLNEINNRLSPLMEKFVKKLRELPDEKVPNVPEEKNITLKRIREKHVTQQYRTHFDEVLACLDTLQLAEEKFFTKKLHLSTEEIKDIGLMITAWNDINSKISCASRLAEKGERDFIINQLHIYGEQDEKSCQTVIAELDVFSKQISDVYQHLLLTAAKMIDQNIESNSTVAIMPNLIAEKFMQIANADGNGPILIPTLTQARNFMRYLFKYMDSPRKNGKENDKQRGGNSNDFPNLWKQLEQWHEYEKLQSWPQTSNHSYTLFKPIKLSYKQLIEKLSSWNNQLLIMELHNNILKSISEKAEALHKNFNAITRKLGNKVITGIINYKNRIAAINKVLSAPPNSPTEAFKAIKDLFNLINDLNQEIIEAAKTDNTKSALKPITENSTVLGNLSIGTISDQTQQLKSLLDTLKKDDHWKQFKINAKKIDALERRIRQPSTLSSPGPTCSNTT